MVLLLFAAICSLQSLACAITPELSSGETVGQWVWLGKAVLFSSGAFLLLLSCSCSERLTGKMLWSSGIFMLMWRGV